MSEEKQSEGTPPPASQSMRTSVAYLTLALTPLLWATGIVIGRGVHETVPPVGLSFWRWLLAALFLLPLAWPTVSRQMPVVRANLKVFFLQGGMLVGSATLLLVALNFTTALNVTLVNAAQPTMTVLLSWALLRDRIKSVQWLGVVSALAGVAVMVTKADWQTIAGFDFNTGDILVIGSIIGFSIYALNIRNLPPELGLVPALFVIFICGSLLLLPVYVLESVFMRTVPLDLTAFVSVLGLAAVSMASMLMWNAGNRAVGHNRAAVFVNLLPVYGAALAITFLGERLFPYHIAGAILVCCGIFLVVRGNSH